jgi:hypothetical protein
LALDFDSLQGLQSQDELAGSQLGGAPPTWTQEGAGTQPGGSQLPGATGGAQPRASQLPSASGGAQPRASQLPGASGRLQSSPGGAQLPGASSRAQQSPEGSQLPAGASGGQPGSSHEVVGWTAAVATPQPTCDARRRQIHPPDPLTYPREQTHAAARAARMLKKPRRC